MGHCATIASFLCIYYSSTDWLKIGKGVIQGCILSPWLFNLYAQMVKNPPAMRETWVWSLGWEDPLEEGMATHSSIFAWRIPMHRGSCGPQSMWCQGVRHNWATKQQQQQSTSCEMLGWMNHKLESRLPGEIFATLDINTTLMLIIPPKWQKMKRK